MSQATVLSFTDEHGSRLEAPLSSIKKWTNINGIGNHDLAPGEIATHSEAINGQVFMGPSSAPSPCAQIHGVLQSPLELWIENSTICSVASDAACGGFHRIPECQPFQPPGGRAGDRHPRGGQGICTPAMPGSRSAIAACTWAWAAGQKGSHHLDLIFASGVLALDDKPVFDGTFAFLSTDLEKDEDPNAGAFLLPHFLPVFQGKKRQP